MQEAYRAYSKIYDQVHERRQSTDVPFWVSEAMTASEPLLEIACGSGRIALPIARQGIIIHGIDSSQEMIKLLEKRLSSEQKGVKDLLTYEIADMRTFGEKVTSKYGLAFVAFSALQYMHTNEDQHKVFSTIHKTLRPGGVFIVDVFNPNPAFISKWGQPLEMGEIENSPKDGERIIWQCVPQSFDAKTKILTMPNQFQIYHNNAEKPETIMIPAQYYCFSQDELKALFTQSGFEVIATFGNYDKSPYTPENPRIIMKGTK
jgi:SAM-dependent methyltransferase